MFTWVKRPAGSTIALLMLFAALANGVNAQTFNKQGFYVIQHDGWIRSAVPDGDAFTCIQCKNQVQIQISFGEPMARRLSEKEFMSALDTEAKRKDFAKSIVEKAIPMKEGYSIDVYRTSITEIGGIKVAQFAAAVDMGRTLSHDISMVGLHRNRIVKITLNYFDGTITPEVTASIHTLYSSLKFD